MFNSRFILLLAFFIPAPSLEAETLTDTLEIQKSKSPVIFDGRCDESVWNEISPIELMMYQPNHGSMPTEKSEVFLTYDDNYLYLAGRLYYQSGTKITATSKKRDAFDPGNDYLGLLLDTFNDNENGLCFMTSPEGIRVDFAIANDAIPPLQGFPFIESWNTFWDTKSTVENNVWHVEIRIPFSSLRFQVNSRKVTMGIILWRYIADKQEKDIFPLMPNTLGPFSPWKPSQSKKAMLTAIDRKNPVYITPYVLGGLEQTQELNESGDSYNRNDKFKHTAGLDLKYSLTSNLTMDMSVNTDFAQVESDDQMINLTRFDLFYPEKRQFFLERSSLFDFKSGFFDQLFYSRRIGLYEGEIVPIYGGIRTVGRVGKWDIGMLDMQSAGIDYYDEDLDSTYRVQPNNSGVLRIRRQVINPRSYLGGIMTSKVDLKGSYNINPGFDGILNLFNNDYLTFNYSHTIDNSIPGNQRFVDNGKLYLDWDKRTDVGFGYTFDFARAGKNYSPELGFEMFEDYTSLFSEFRYGWVNNNENKNMLKHRVFFWAWMQKRNQEFKTDLFWLVPGWYFETKNGYFGSLMLFNHYENPTDTFEISDTEYFSPGIYRYATLEGLVNTPGNKVLSLQIAWILGTYYDGYILSLGPAKLTARISSSVQLALDYQFNRIDVPSRDQHYVSHLTRLKTEFTFTTKWSLLMFLQYSSTDKFGVNNIRLRFNPREGNDLYLVYNEGYNTYRYREFPVRPFTDSRSILLKYTYTFIFNK